MLSAPVPITAGHDTTDFDSGTASLDDWLKRRALANQAGGASRTFVVCDANRTVGYFALAAGSVAIAEAAGAFRRNMPDPVPVIVLARLAVHRDWQGQGIGRALFRDAARRVIAASNIVGARGMIVHAISEEARMFYEAVGMRPSPINPMTLMVTMADLRAAV